MERHDRLQRLKQGEFPDDFSSRIGDKSECMESCIKDMLSQGDTAVNVAMLKERLHSIIATSA